VTAWPEVALGDVALRLQDGPFGSNLKSSHYMAKGVRVIRLQNIGVASFDDTNRAFVSEEHFDRLKKHGCLPGDVLIATLGDPILRACLQPAWIPVALNKADCLLLRCDPDRALPEYVVRVLNSPQLQKQAELLSHGQTRPRINLSQLRSLPIPLPPLGEQRRIAAVLSQADELRAKRRASLALLDSLIKSIFLDMFGDREDFKGCKRSPLADHLVFLTSGSRGWARYYADTGAMFLRIQNVKRDELDLSDIAFVDAPENAEARRTKVRLGDVLMSITADLGRSGVVPPEADGAFINQHLCLMRTKTLVPRFLSAFLTTADAIRQIARKNRAAVKAGLNFDDVRTLEIPVPPYRQQQEFAKRAGSVDENRRRLRSGLGQADDLFTGLEQRAFAGHV